MAPRPHRCFEALTVPPSSTRLARICFWVAFAARSVLFVSAPSAALNWVKACEELGSGLGLGAVMFRLIPPPGGGEAGGGGWGWRWGG